MPCWTSEEHMISWMLPAEVLSSALMPPEAQPPILCLDDVSRNMFVPRPVSSKRWGIRWPKCQAGDFCRNPQNQWDPCGAKPSNHCRSGISITVRCQIGGTECCHIHFQFITYQRRAHRFISQIRYAVTFRNILDGYVSIMGRDPLSVNDN